MSTIDACHGTVAVAHITIGVPHATTSSEQHMPRHRQNSTCHGTRHYIGDQHATAPSEPHMQRHSQSSTCMHATALSEQDMPRHRQSSTYHGSVRLAHMPQASHATATFGLISCMHMYACRETNQLHILNVLLCILILPSYEC